MQLEGGREEGGDLISRGKFLMQGDPREIKTAGLITGGAARDEFIFTAVEKYRLKRTITTSTGLIILPSEGKEKKKKKQCGVCFCVCVAATESRRAVIKM